MPCPGRHVIDVDADGKDSFRDAREQALGAY